MRAFKNRVRVLAFLLSLTCLAGCTARPAVSSENSPGTSEPQSGTTSAVTTQTPTTPELLPAGVIVPITDVIGPDSFEVEKGVDIARIKEDCQSLTPDHYKAVRMEAKGYDYERNDDILSSDEWYNTGAVNLFDGDPTTRFWTTASGAGDYGPLVVWEMDQPVTVEAYIIQNADVNTIVTNGSLLAQFYLLGCNEYTQLPGVAEGLNGWHILDFVGNADMPKGKLSEKGFAVDEVNRGAYRYYCLYVTFYSESKEKRFELSELKLYGKVEPEPGIDVAGIRKDYSALNAAHFEKIICDRFRTYHFPGECDPETCEDCRDKSSNLFDGDCETVLRTVSEELDHSLLSWKMDTPVTVQAYAFLNPDNAEQGSGCVLEEFYLLAADRPMDGIPDLEVDFSEYPLPEGWVILDYVRNGGLTAENSAEKGFAVDEEKQGSYQYYALYVEWTYPHGDFVLSELELYGKAD